MALFLSTYVNKVDKKGRVSVPASFRAAVADLNFQGVVLFASQNYACLEGFSMDAMDEIANRMDQFDLFSQEQDDFAMAVLSQSLPLPFDGDGRIILPDTMIEFAGLQENAAFVGLGKKFQIWNPENLEARRLDARQNAKGMTLSKGDR